MFKEQGGIAFRGEVAHASVRTGLTVAVVLCLSVLAYAGTTGLTIDPTFSPSLDTTADQQAIDAAISNIEGSIASPNNITVTIYFNSVSSGLGEYNTGLSALSYLQYYDAYAAVATSADQIAALNSLGAAPTVANPENPVDGSSLMLVTSAEASNLGFNALPQINSSNSSGLIPTGNTETYDAAIGLNASITSPEGTSDTYSLESAAINEIDDVLGIGAGGSMLANGDTGAVGDLDLYRYSASGTRSYSTTSPSSYFSIDGGETVLSYFNQTAGLYGDWLSNPIPNGYGVQVQDASGTIDTNPTLGPNELIAFNVIGYDVVTPEPSTFVPAGLGLILIVGFARRRQSANR